MIDAAEMTLVNSTELEITVGKLSQFARKSEAKVTEVGSFSDSVKRGVEYVKNAVPDLMKNLNSDQFEEAILKLEGEFMPEEITRVMREKRVSFETAYDQHRLASFVIRNKLVGEVMRRVEVRDQRGVPGEKMRQRQMERIILMHFVLTSAEMDSQSGTLDHDFFNSLDKQNFFALHTEIFGAIAARGQKKPDEVEEIFSKMALMNKRKFDAYKNGGGFLGESEIVQKRDEGLFFDRIGIRAEVVSYHLLNKIFQDDIRERTFPNGIRASEFRVVRASPEADRDGLMDWAVVATLHLSDGTEIQNALLFGVDVKSENNVEIRDPNQIGRENFDIGASLKHRIQDFNGATVKIEGDDTNKLMAPQTTSFVLKCGVPVVALRIPGVSGFDRSRKLFRTDQMPGLDKIYQKGHFIPAINSSYQKVSAVADSAIRFAIEEYGK